MITNKLLNLCQAMSEFEGWKPDGNFEKQAKFPSVSYRNHNPGNLRSSPFALGERDAFAFFVNDSVGMFAMVWDIMKKCKGETSSTLTGDSTLADLITVYACVSDEPLLNYLKHIEERTGFGAYKHLKEFII